MRFNDILMVAAQEGARTAGGGGSGITGTLIYTGESASNISVAVTAGKVYAIGSWVNGGGDMTVDGSSSGVVKVTPANSDYWGVFVYTPASSGTKTFEPQNGCNFVFVMEIDGGTYNSTGAGIVFGSRSGSYTAPAAVTDFTVMFLTNTGTAPTANMTFDAQAVGGTRPFFCYHSDTTVTPSGTWDGVTALAAIGFS